MDPVLVSLGEFRRDELVVNLRGLGHLFYVSDPDLFIQSLGKHRKALGDFKVSFEKHDDPKWRDYDDFPGGD